MKHALFAAAALAATVLPAAAQYYPVPPQGGYYPPQGGYYRPRPPPGYYRPDPYGGYGYRQRPVIMGNICYTSRGSCPTRPRPAESPCTCMIPGFGPKRGGVVAGGW
jgi:hypothetical protein